MFNEDALRDSIRTLVSDVIREEVVKNGGSSAGTAPGLAGQAGQAGQSPNPIPVTAASNLPSTETVEEVPDATLITMEDTFWVPNAHDEEGYRRMKQFTSGRLGIWRAGPRPLTKAYVRAKADHAAAQGTVWSNVGEQVISSLGFIPLQSRSADKAEYLKKPPTGKRLTDESVEIVKKNAQTGKQVQIVFSDGLSSKAIEKNAKDFLPALKQGLQAFGISVADPIFFVNNGRVAVSEEIGELTDAEVVIMLTGERPGLNSQTSMGAYLAYRPTIGMEESRRTVISNIHAKGTPPVEAGAQIAELAQSMLQHKMSGVDLKLV
ncbi:MAG: ethanolamine ammonia-lyase subunit EutC [Coriobacteriales bacterium]|jgi:ethanolamine ammonia-lyase small subunit|nr:ethanolamine ammonia-lyase subunit EutC [Coriobacteriales bacterium]